MTGIINKHIINVSGSTTILYEAEKLGITIPTLCYSKNLKPSGSCMVCVVEDKTSGKFIPSCSSLFVNGMNIETDNEKIQKLRKTAVELLLSDHNGDCDAPCQRACPYEKDIPEIFRLIAENKTEEAAKLNSASCSNCIAHCEKVCRRNAIDSSLKIKYTHMYLEENLNGSFSEKNRSSRIKRFNSSYGKISDTEKIEFLKEAQNKQACAINGQSNNITEILNESKRCMHCDCRKKDNCKLRDSADLFESKQRTFQLNERGLTEKTIYPQNIIFEPMKCIKCGNCIKVTEQEEKIPFTFIGRGFNVKVSLPINNTDSEILKKTAASCVENCPTGALSFFTK